MTTIVSFRTKPEYKERIDFLAKEAQRNPSFFYNKLLENYLDELEDIYLSERILENIRSGKEKTYSSSEVRKALNI